MPLVSKLPTQRRAMVLTMLCCTGIAVSSATYAMEIDAMPLAIAREAFLQLRPGARAVGLSGEAQDYLYLAPPKTAAFGSPVATFARGFVGDAGCAASVGFGEFPGAQAAALTARLAAMFPTKKGEHSYPEGQGTVLYLENVDAFAAVTQLASKGSGNLSVALSVSLKPCSMNVPRGRWQTRPR